MRRIALSLLILALGLGAGWGQDAPRVGLIWNHSGLPATLPTPGPGQSFGLAQVRERLATLHGAAGALELIAVQPSGTSATVTFPLKSADTP